MRPEKSTPVERISAFLPRLYWPLLLLLCVSYAWRPLEGGSDFWAHAAVGKWIWTNGRVPRHSLFLWSEPNFPWIAHSWLSQLFFYGLITRFGAKAVIVFSAAVVALVFFLLWRTWKREAEISFWAPLVFTLAISVSAPRMMPRPELFSALFLVLLLAFLIAWQNGRFDDWLQHKGIVDASLVAIPVITVMFLWINFHAVAGIGLLVLAVTVFLDGAQAVFGKDRFDAAARHRARVLCAIGVLCAAAALCNPYGLEYRQAFMPVGGEMFKHIDEWKPFWVGKAATLTSAATTMYDSAALEAILLLIALGSWLANPQRRWSQLAWLLIGALIFVQARRMLWISAIIFVAVTGANARYLDTPTLWRKWRRLSKGDPYQPIPDPMRLIAHVGAVLTILVSAVMAAANHTSEKSGAWNTFARDVPSEKAIRFLLKNQSHHIFNGYEVSSYLQWRLNAPREAKKISSQGRKPLYIDLLNAYPDRLMTEYFHILDATPKGQNALNSRKIDCVVLAKTHWKKPLVKHLAKIPGWRQGWSDEQTKIWTRTLSTRPAPRRQTRNGR